MINELKCDLSLLKYKNNSNELNKFKLGGTKK
jgi:hypothetical protein